MTARMLLLGLDGGTFTLLDPLIEAGAMPFLAGLAAEGVRAELRSTVPALTPPAWTSLMTGCHPGRHGIFDFFVKDAPGDRHIRVADSRDVRVPTVWALAAAAGLRTTVLNFPMTFPAPALDGFVVPGWMPWRQLRLGCHPAGLFDRLRALPGLDVRRLAMDMTTEAKAIEGCAPDEHEAWVALHLERERQWHRVARYLMDEEPCELTAVLFEGPDKIQHLCWRLLDPAAAGAVLDPRERRVREACFEYYRELDRLLADLAAAASASGRSTALSSSTPGSPSAAISPGPTRTRRWPATPPSSASASWPATPTASTGSGRWPTRRPPAATASTSCAGRGTATAARTRPIGCACASDWPRSSRRWSIRPRASASSRACGVARRSSPARPKRSHPI
jgi:predicted AlkP superfamily phosphohydrolase/phosphomutase